MMKEKNLLDKKFDWVGPPNKLSNIRPIKFVKSNLNFIFFRLKIVQNESISETNYRKAREALNQWNCDFWTSHNRLFEVRKEQFYKEVFLKILYEVLEKKSDWTFRTCFCRRFFCFLQRFSY